MYFLTTFKILFSFWAGTEKIFPSLIQPIQLTSMSEVKKKYQENTWTTFSFCNLWPIRNGRTNLHGFRLKAAWKTEKGITIYYSKLSEALKKKVL